MASIFKFGQKYLLLKGILKLEKSKYENINKQNQMFAFCGPFPEDGVASWTEHSLCKTSAPESTSLQW